MKSISSKAAALIPQPNSQTCQSACVARAIGNSDIFGIRQELQLIGDAGSPQVMGVLLKRKLGERYSFDEDASLNDCKNWLNDGSLLITHGWFTPSGHVITLDGYEIDESTLSYRVNVGDPWDEFDAPNWRYTQKSDKYDGFYSSRCIYAACVASKSFDDAASIYRRGELDSNKGGMWVHRIKP